MAMEYPVPEYDAVLVAEVLVNDRLLYAHPESLVLKLFHEGFQTVAVFGDVKVFLSHDYNNHTS